MLLTRVTSWPYYVQDPEAYKEKMSEFYYFMIEGYEKPFGYVHSSFVSAMQLLEYWTRYWSLDHEGRFLTLLYLLNAFKSRTNVMHTTLRTALADGIVNHWANELFPIYSSTGGHILDMDGCGVDPFGIVSYAVHMIAYVENKEQGRKFWVPRRAKTKKSYPRMLDNTVGGSLRSGERPIDCIVREAAEEGGFPEEYTRENVRACGTLAYSMDRTDDGKEGCQHQVQYLYEMEVPEGFVPKPCDGEVEEFMLIGIEEVVGALRGGEFKLNCGMTWMSYLVKHGIVNAENEKRLLEICARMHRKHDLFVV